MADIVKELVGDQILVKSIPTEETKGIVWIPTEIREGTQKSIVVQFGERPPNSTMCIGDTVLHARNLGIGININGEDYLIMRYSQLFAIL